MALRNLLIRLNWWRPASWNWVLHSQEDQLEPAVDNMQERLKANGFYNARIMTEVSHVDLTEEANIRFTVSTGDRARFAGVTFSGTFTKPKDSPGPVHRMAASLRVHSA